MNTHSLKGPATAKKKPAKKKKKKKGASEDP